MNKYINKKSIIIVFIMLIFSIASIVFVYNDHFLYKEPILKIKTISEEKLDGYTEPYFIQTITGTIVNGEYKGKNITFTNNYSYSEVYSDKLSKNSEVMLELSKDGDSVLDISNIKRDKYMVTLFVIFIDLIIIIAGIKGIKTIISLFVNIIITIMSVYFYKSNYNHISLLALYLFICILYIVCSLLITNKKSKKVLSAIVSSIISLIISFTISYIVIKIYNKSIPYWTMSYIDSIFDYKNYFYVSILLCGLGAIMDVAITMSSSLNELILKDPNISEKSLIKSGMEISKDITGTMLNVMFYTMYVSIIPTLLIAFKNNVSLSTSLSYYGKIELITVLCSCISIVLTIPISLYVSVYIFKRFKVGDKK